MCRRCVGGVSDAVRGSNKPLCVKHDTAANLHAHVRDLMQHRSRSSAMRAKSGTLIVLCPKVNFIRCTSPAGLPHNNGLNEIGRRTTSPQTQTYFHSHRRMHSGRGGRWGGGGWRGASRRIVGHRAMTSQHRASVLYLCNRPPAPPRLAGEEAPEAESGGGLDTGRWGSDLISQEGKEKGGERRIRAQPLQYFIL